MDRRKTDSREKILEGARELFAARGYSATPVSEIANAAELSEGAIYRYFSSKEDLLLACVRPALEESLDLITEQKAGVNDLHSLMRLLLEKRLELFRKHYSAYKILFSEAYYNRDLFQLMCESVWPDHRIEEGTELLLSFGEIKKMRNYLTIMLGQIFSLWGIYHLRSMTGEWKEYLPEALGQLSDQDLLDDMNDFILYGITGSPPKNPG